MQRHTFQNKQLKLSYLDSGGSGNILIALHAHWMEASTFAQLAAALSPTWRIIALDQRGHGYSDHAKSYTRDDYISDLMALFAHLEIKQPVVILGNSLGGVNTYQFAARYPHLVRAMIIEDIGVEISVDVNFSLAWSGTFKTREELANVLGSNLLPALQDSFRETKEGWRLAFEPQEMVASNYLLQGDHWTDWLATDCRALVIRGEKSRITTREHLEEMARRRPNTLFCELAGGHVVHFDNPIAFTAAIKDFLQTM